MYSLQEYSLAMQIRKEKEWGGKKIHLYMATLGMDVPTHKIEAWIYRKQEPFITKIIKQVKETSKELTPKKAYIIGTICGDGYLTTDNRIGLSVCDKDFAEYFKCCLENVYGIQCVLRVRDTKYTNFCKSPKRQYVVFLASKLIAEDLLNYMDSYKTRRWRVPLQIQNSTKENQAAFIRGFADSEGSVRLRKGHGEIALHSINKESLVQVQELLKVFEVKSSINYKKGGYYIDITNYDSLKKFNENIGFIIKRKQAALSQLLTTYKRKGLRKYSEEYKVLAMQLLKQGLNHRQIAKLMSTSYCNIYDWEKALKKNRGDLNER